MPRDEEERRRLRVGRQLIAARVAAAAWRRGWTNQETAAKHLGISANTYRQVVTNMGHYHPSGETLRRLAEGLDLDLLELAQLSLGVYTTTGDAALDEHIEHLRLLDYHNRRPIYLITRLIAGLPPDDTPSEDHFKSGD